LKPRIGIGYDIHPLVEGRPLFLGGIEIPHHKGLKGHSDGDCLIHALVDALLGALGAGDIGQWFPDSDSRYKGARSTRFLEEVAGVCREREWTVGHVDSIIIAEKPLLTPFFPRMKETLCPLLGIGVDALSIKAKTKESLGAVGREEAIASWAAVILYPR